VKIRALQKKLKTEYVIRNKDDKSLTIGSSFIPDLIIVLLYPTRLTKSFVWRVDGYTDHEKELTRIYLLLQQLVSSGKMGEFLTGKDDIENPLPVYSVKDGCIIEGFTDKYGWPNITDRGYLMYENQFFSTPEAAIEKGIREARADVKFAVERVEECTKALEDARSWLATKESHLISLESLAGGSND
jgi:hypothetical protein